MPYSDYLVVLRGRMGDWTYYVTAMKLAKVARETRFAEDLHKTTELDELMQREIGDRVKKEMVPYLLHQPQRFYGALIVAVYGGEPEFSPVKIAEHDLLDDTESSTYGFGLLRFDGSQQYFALDGQHRLKSIQLALEQNPDLGREEVTVIIVKHESDADGLARTRRLFSTLNQRAEKTNVGLNIAINEDDPVAIVTRRIVRDHKYLGELFLVKANKDGLGSKQLSTSAKDAPYFTTLRTLYECNDYLLKAFGGGMDIDKSNRPEPALLDEFYTYLSAIWCDIFEAAPDLAGVREKRQKPGTLRIDKRAGGGGSAIGRPNGQLIIAEVIQAALLEGRPQTAFIQRLFAETAWDLDAVPWRKLVWNPDSRTIIGTSKERKLLVHLLLHKFSLRIPLTQTALRDEYRSLTQDKTAKLLRVPDPAAPEAA